MEQKPKRGAHDSAPRPSRQHSYHEAAGMTSDEAARIAFRRAKRKKQVRRNRIIGLLILLVLLALLILGIVGAVRFFTRDRAEPASAVSEASVASQMAEDNSQAQSGAAVVTPQEPEENPDEYDYYVEGIPVLLNRYNPLPADLQGDIEVEAVGIRPDTGEMHSLVPAAAEAFLAMVEAAAEDGVKLYPVSGYRPHSRQVNNYEASVGNYMAQGLTREAAEAEAGKLIAVPGTSEHEAGLAIDINSLDQSFEYTEAFTWLSENCNDYGFILRYEKTTYAETGIDYEPWHYRYVGQNHAYAITELGLTLEAYVAYLGGEVKTAGGTLAAPDVSVSASSGGGTSSNSTNSGGTSSSSLATAQAGAEMPMG